MPHKGKDKKPYKSRPGHKKGKKWMPETKNWPSLGHLMALLFQKMMENPRYRSNRECAEKELGWIWLRPGVKY